mgnify:CR=1 FL=1
MDEVDELAMGPMRYFAHDADAALDPKCRRLIRQAGVAGYGRWWLLCEALASEEGHEVGCATPNDLMNLAVVLELDGPEEAREFLSLLQAIGLVQISGGCVSSKRMFENARYFGRRRLNGKKGMKARWGKNR